MECIRNFQYFITRRINQFTFDSCNLWFSCMHLWLKRTPLWKGGLDQIAQFRCPEYIMWHELCDMQRNSIETIYYCQITQYRPKDISNHRPKVYTVNSNGLANVVLRKNINRLLFPPKIHYKQWLGCSWISWEFESSHCSLWSSRDI